MEHRIAISADHRGFLLKQYLIAHLGTVQWFDYGTHTPERTDYPLFVPPLVEALKAGMVDYGILICGTGVGMAIAANRHRGIYAGLVWNAEVARRAKEDDNVNVLVIPADYLTKDEAVKCIASWIAASFKGGRYQERLSLIDPS